MGRVIAGAVALALATSAAAFAWSTRALPDLEVRTSVLLTQVGSTDAAGAAGQGFVAARDGLWRIDLAVTPIGDQRAADLELVLRADGPMGPELRRARAHAGPRQALGGWLEWATFTFEPVVDSAGRAFHASLLPGPWYVSTCLRVRGMPGRSGSWGDGVVHGPLTQGELLSEQPHLRALAFAAEHLEGPARLTLFDAQTQVRVARVERDVTPAVQAGWVVFEFPALEADVPGGGSRWRRYRWELEVAPQAELRARAGSPNPIAFHGSGEVSPRLLGFTRGGLAQPGGDLVLRAWSAHGPRAGWRLLAERMGSARWTVLALLAGWAACAAWALPRSPRKG